MKTMRSYLTFGSAVLGWSVATVVALVCGSCQSGGSTTASGHAAVLPSDMVLYQESARRAETGYRLAGYIRTGGFCQSARRQGIRLLACKPIVPAARRFRDSARRRKVHAPDHVLQGPDHVSRAQALRDQLKATTHDNKWYIVHATDKSTVYYGFYKEINHDTHEGQSAQRDREFLSSLQTATGDLPLGAYPLCPRDHQRSARPRGMGSRQNRADIRALLVAADCLLHRRWPRGTSR